MDWVISAGIAYLLCGVAQVMKDLGGPTIDRPSWTFRPTFSKAVLIALTWFTRSFIEHFYRPKGQRARGIAYGVLGFVVQLATTTLFVWGCIWLAHYFFDGNTARFIAGVLFVLVGMAFVVPLLGVLTMPLVLLLAIPIEWMFPRNTDGDAKAIRWCRTCKHHKPVKEFEDTMSGLWQATVCRAVTSSPARSRSKRRGCGSNTSPRSARRAHFSQRTVRTTRPARDVSPNSIIRPRAGLRCLRQSTSRARGSRTGAAGRADAKRA